MFTGIVQGLRHVTAVNRQPGGSLTLGVQLDDLSQGIQLGASVAINGCCLTVARQAQGLVRFDVIPETLGLTNLGLLRTGDEVNVERSARMQDEIGGHRVSGHVSGVARIASIAVRGDDYRIRLQTSSALMSCLLLKGFVALDGASLTISAVDLAKAQIEVSLIPETLQRTLFGRRNAGDAVNLEVDPMTQAVVDTVRRLFADPGMRAQMFGEQLQNSGAARHSSGIYDN